MSQITIGTVVYNLYAQNGLRAEYIGPNHSDVNKDLLILTTSQPSRSSANNGARRGSMTFVRTVDVPSICDPTCIGRQDQSIKIMTSIPVGMADADFVAGLAVAADFAAATDLVRKVATKGQLINL